MALVSLFVMPSGVLKLLGWVGRGDFVIEYM
jgi:hypothetical protein